MSTRVGPTIGESFGGYRIESVLGRGGMGTVYLATHERLERRAAVKVIAPEIADDERFRTRFLGESRLAASLDHPHVIPIYDAGEIDGVLYLAMRFVAGPSLQVRLEDRVILGLDEALAVAEQIGGALEAAHRTGLVHRDVKPANILVAEPGDHLYLCDFGLARATSARGVTRTGSFFGSVDFVAPEQIQGLPIDGRADVYSLGCVLYRCLAGTLPFARETDFAVLQAHLADPPPPASSVRPGLPQRLDAVLFRALSKRPEERFATASSFAEALRDAVYGPDAPSRSDATRPAPTGGPAPARKAATDRVTEPGSRPPRRAARRWAAALAALVVVALGVTAFVLVQRGPHGGSGRESSAEARTFVDRLENVLEQSSGGRREVASALAAGLDCSIGPRVAARRIGSATENRQSILDQIGTMHAPTPDTARVVTLLQRALQESIEADRHYRDGFAGAPLAVCPPPPGRDFPLARASDARATTAKERFVSAFNRLARRFDRRTWLASEI